MQEVSDKYYQAILDSLDKEAVDGPGDTEDNQRE